MATNRLLAFSVATGAHTFRFFAETGGEIVGSAVSATEASAGSHLYYADIPPSTPAAQLVFGLYDDADSELRATGDFVWNGSAIVTTADMLEGNATVASVNAARDAITSALLLQNDLSAAEVRAEVDASVGQLNDLGGGDVITALRSTEIFGAGGTYLDLIRWGVRDEIAGEGYALTADVNAARDAVRGDIAALVIPSVAEIEAALLDDADGSAVLAAISAAVEASLGDDTDGDAFLATIQAACAAAITDKALATATSLSTAQTLIRSDVEAVRDAVDALDPATPNDLLTTQNALSNKIGTDANYVRDAVIALNDLSAADVTAAVDLSGLSTAVDVDNTRTAIETSISALNDLSAADVTAAVDLAPIATIADVHAARDLLQGEVADVGTALTDVATDVTRALDIAEADEQYSTTDGVARKFIRGTDTLLIEKDLVTTSPAAVTTTLTQPPETP